MSRKNPPRLTHIALAALCLASILGALGRFSWLFDLFSHFQVQYAALFAGIGCYALIRRHWRPALVAAVGLVYNALPIAVQMFPDAAADDHHANRFAQVRIVSFNVFDEHTPIDRLAGFLAETNADIVILQEFHPDRLPALQQELTSLPHAAIQVGRKAYGIVILSRWPVVTKKSIPLAGDENHASLAVIDVHGQMLSVYGVHLHWPVLRRTVELRNIELKNLAAALQRCVEPCIAVGDFNLTPWSPYYTEFVRNSGAADCARGHGLLPTWPTFFRPLGIRIDHCFVKGAVNAQAVQIGPALGSDHFPTISDLVLHNLPLRDERRHLSSSRHH